jgi:hypothetical protein
VETFLPPLTNVGSRGGNVSTGPPTKFRLPLTPPDIKARRVVVAVVVVAVVVVVAGLDDRWPQVASHEVATTRRSLGDRGPWPALASSNAAALANASPSAANSHRQPAGRIGLIRQSRQTSAPSAPVTT